MNNKLSRIGFGAWGLGGDAYGYIDPSEAINALKTAFSNGINFIDTSDLYGAGKSEKIIGSFLSTLNNNDKEQILIASKGGCLPHRGFDMPQNFSYEYLVNSLESSLKNLNINSLFIYFLHSPLPLEIDLEVINKFAEYAISSGKCKNIGISLRSPKDIIYFCKNLEIINSYQFNFNLIDQRILSNELLPYFKNKKHINIARTPLCFGFLTGKVNIKDCFSHDDHRRNWPKEQLEKWNNSVEFFRDIADSLNLTTTQLALQFCNSYQFIDCTIPGILTPKHAEENSSVLKLPRLEKRILIKLEEIYHKNSFYDPSLKENALKKEISQKK